MEDGFLSRWLVALCESGFELYSRKKAEARRHGRNPRTPKLSDEEEFCQWVMDETVKWGCIMVGIIGFMLFALCTCIFWDVGIVLVEAFYMLHQKRPFAGLIYDVCAGFTLIRALYKFCRNIQKDALKALERRGEFHGERVELASEHELEAVNPRAEYERLRRLAALNRRPPSTGHEQPLHSAAQNSRTFTTGYQQLHPFPEPNSRPPTPNFARRPFPVPDSPRP